MVIADRCALLVNTVYGNYMDYYGFQVITANMLFAVQIYCDFMGYSVIARGAAKILGYELMENFERPYLARSIRDFWRRWHISLSSWLRDYLYIPLGGVRQSKVMKYRNIMITFLVSGLWHGADVTFVIWGGIHGGYQIIQDIFSSFLKRLCEKLQIDTHTFSWNCLRMISTFVFVDLAWVFFRADKITDAFGILQNSLDLSNTGLVFNHGLCQLGLDERNMCILLIGIAALAAYSLLTESGRDVMAWLSGQCMIFRYAVYWVAVLLITFSMDIIGQEFIYFQF